MEVGVQVLAEEPFTGDVRHTCTAYLTFVQLRAAGGTLTPLTPATPAERRHWEAAEKRQAARVARIHQLRESLATEPPW